MYRKPLLWKLFPIYFIITLISVFVVGMYASHALRNFYYSQAESNLEVVARLVNQDITDAFSCSNSIKLATLVNSLARTSNTRITVISPLGKVIADSKYDYERMQNHSNRPEFKQAIIGRVGRSRRFSRTLGYTMVYVAVPIHQNGKIVGVLRTSIAATALDSAPEKLYHRIAMGTLLIALLAGIVSLMAARRISEPLTKMKDVTAKFARGDFKSHVPVPDTEELANLADTLNLMASQLDMQVRTITHQAGQLQAILASMQEAVIAIDNNDCILILNPSAERLLDVSLEDVKGKTIQEAIRNAGIQRFIENTRKSDMPTSDEIDFHAAEPKLVQAIGTALMDSDNKKIGVLAVLNDITQTRKLENMRKDFVANVSHELRTPITSIKGFVETLQEGAINDPAKSKEFLAIVARQADRLNAIIEDLLALSKIEQKSEIAAINLESGKICDVLRAAVSNLQTKASEHDVNVEIDCDESIYAQINAPLLEQAVTNLIDNAIKYSHSGSRVKVKSCKDAGEVLISVIDNGVGIESEHIPRLFERFYRVDKARSRKLGGTGLGLAIVKHIVQAHHGSIEVQSLPGEGSTFTIRLR